MSIDLERRPLVAALRQELRHELDALRGNWFWFVILGVSLVVLGTVALGSVVIASLAAAAAIGVLLLLGGAAEAVGAFWCRGWSGFFLELLSGVLSIVVGLLFLRAPVGALAALTLLLACFLMVGGFFKIVAAVVYRFAAWGWSLAGGIIDVILGRDDLAGVAGVGAVGDRPVRGDQPAVPRIQLDRPRAGAALATPPADGLSPSREHHSGAEQGPSDARVFVRVDGR